MNKYTITIKQRNMKKILICAIIALSVIAFARKDVQAQWVNNFNGGKDTTFYKQRSTQSDSWAIHIVWSAASGTGGKFSIVTSNDGVNWNTYASNMKDTILAATGNQMFMDYKLMAEYIGVKYTKSTQTSANIDIYFKQR